MNKGQGPRMLFGLIVVFVLFQWIASALGSFRGEAGVLVGVIVVAATLVAEKVLFRKSFKEAAKGIGLGRPMRFGMLAAVAVSSLLLLMVPIFLLQSGSSLSLYPGWLTLLPGLFFQAGIAEETLFRGYLFGHMRQRHTFWKAAAFAAIPFVLVHLILFYSLPWSLAGASILLAIAMSFPLSKLYEMGGDTMWAPAIVHFVAQGAVKVIVISGESASMFPFFWIAASPLIPLTVYAFPPLMKLINRGCMRTAVIQSVILILIVSNVILCTGQSRSRSSPGPESLQAGKPRAFTSHP
jgi:membrane protease YdiL (CAAX protease family)